MKETSSELVKILEERREYLEATLISAVKKSEYLENALKNAIGQDGITKTSPFHKIRVQKHGRGYQYYMRSDEKDTVGKYLRKSREKFIKQTLQEEYLLKAINIMEKELKVVDNYLNSASPIQLKKYYESMNRGRQIMINPIEADDETFVKEWLNISYEGKGFMADSPDYYTKRKERVRSKSEIIIANTLNEYGIPYRYEYPIQVRGMGTVYPDFTVLNVRKRKEMYWEHFGLLDDYEYRENAMRKVSLYEKNDIFQGDKLILTCESAAQPLSVEMLEKKIEKYLL